MQSAGYGMGAWVMALLMIGNAAAMLLAGLGLGRPQRLFTYFTLAVLLVNILLTFTTSSARWT